MTEVEWKAFLTAFNQELLSYEEVIEALSRDVIESAWLGYSGASENELRLAEQRLGTRLPESFRAFLKASDGWRFPSPWIYELLPSAKLIWFREQNQDWIDAYTDPKFELPPIPDEEYFVYGPRQDCGKFRTEYLGHALQISEVGDSAVVLLNPRVLSAEGEWETWFFANWLPGAVRYRTFGEWFEAEKGHCSRQFKRIPKAKVRRYVTAKKPISVKKAQAAARQGRTDLALECLEKFAAKGDDSAAASLAELYAFLGNWERVVQNAGRLIANPEAVYAGNVFADMIRLLGRAGHRSGLWNEIVAVVETALNENARRDFPPFHERTRETREKQFRNLIQYAQRKGSPPHELLAIFGIRGCMDHMTEEELRTWYHNAVRDVDTLRPDLKRKPQAKMEHFFGLAKGVWEDEALRLYQEHGKNFLMAWDSAEYVGRIYARRGEIKRAWEIIQSNLTKWWPVDSAQVTPLVLITDEVLNQLMTPDRCELVLATPRGPEAEIPDQVPLQ